MKTLLLAGAALIFVSAPAAAADDLRVRVGLGAELRPEFIGSDDHEVGPLWDLDFAKGDNSFPFEAPDDSFGIKLISSGRFAAGPAGNIEWKRKESDVGAPVGKVSTTIELGGFAEYWASDSIRLRSSNR